MPRALSPIGITIISPSYAKVGAEAVKRFQKHVGIEVKIHECEDFEGFDSKLELDRICGKRDIIFFDADLWFLDRPNLEKVLGHPCLTAVHDSAVFNPHAFPHTDCERFGMPKTEYFNSGMMVLSFKNPKHVQMFSEARRIHRSLKRKKPHLKPVDITDQFYLNKARLEVGLPWNRLPTAFSYYDFAAKWGQLPCRPRKVIGLHGAGIKAPQKFREMKIQVKVFEHPVCPMHHEALAFMHAIQHDLR